MRECLGKRDKEVIDANVRFACDLHAHNLLLFRTVDPSEIDFDCAQTLACGIVYLQTRHRWNMRNLLVPETEVFEVLQTQRRNLVSWLRGDAADVGTAHAPPNPDARAATARERAEALEAVVRVTAGSGLRHGAAATDESATRRWAAIEEDRSKRPGYTSARFTLSPRAGQPAPGDESLELVTREGKAIDVAAHQARKLSLMRGKSYDTDRSLDDSVDDGDSFGIGLGADDDADAAGGFKEDGAADDDDDEDDDAAKDGDAASASGRSSKKKGKKGGKGGKEKKSHASATTQQIEVDLQTALLTIGSQHMRALDAQYASLRDVVAIFGTQSMQAATVESATHREWVRLVGRGHELQIWKSPDERPTAPHPEGYFREYAPGAVAPHELWIVPLFEPVRLRYFDDPLDPIFIWMPEVPVDASARVVRLVASRPKPGGCWKEIYVLRDLETVHIYDVYSHCRRWVRGLVYTTDTRCVRAASLAFLSFHPHGQQVTGLCVVRAAATRSRSDSRRCRRRARAAIRMRASRRASRSRSRATGTTRVTSRARARPTCRAGC